MNPRYTARAIWRQNNQWHSTNITEHDETRFREAVRRCRARYGANELFELEAWRHDDGKTTSLTVRAGDA